MDEFLIGGGGPNGATQQTLILRRANRHGLIAGATGTGKTVTLQTIAESFSDAGVPVFMADVKGDLSGLAQAGEPADFASGGKFAARLEAIGMGPLAPKAFPVLFWDIFGEQGAPVRTTVTEMGPLLLARLLELNDAQEGVLNIAFRLADEEGLALLDMADLRALLAEVTARRADLSVSHGHVSTASIGAIQRRLLMLETEGAAAFFGEPALALEDLMGLTPDGRGRISILAANRLMRSPRLYATFLLWLLSELFEDLPEVGDPDKPRLVFFFDEAHLLFDNASKPLLEKVEQVARLIRSKGVGVYFVSQSPADIPDDVLGQLGNRVQHALRAYTPRDARALKVAAETFRPNPAFDTAEVLPLLGVGEALVSTLDARGAPRPVARTLIRPPMSRMGPADPAVRAAALAGSPLAGKYETPIDRESAAEILAARAARAAERAADAPAEPDPFAAWNEGRSEGGAFNKGRRWRPGGAAPRPVATPQSQSRSRRGDSVGEAFAKSFARSLGSAAGRRLVRGVLGGLFRGR